VTSRLSAASVAVLALMSAACGYVDDNPRAAAVVAQAYLDAFTERDAPGVCRVSAPEVQAAWAAAGHGSCEAGLEPLGNYPRLRVGPVRKVVPAPPLNPRFAVAVPTQPGREIIVARYGSTWRVVYGGKAPGEP
jgi:hypothetical protein